jgi:hypothetical protein
MKFIALNYSYDLQKMSEIGRKWAYDVYKNNEFILEYSSASYATFIYKNPKETLHLYTDNVLAMKEKMAKYNIDQDRIVYIDYSENLKQYGNDLKYSFTVLNDFINYAKSDSEYTIKIDNDLIFIEKLPEINLNNILVWKYERIVKNGDVRWGEIKICNEVLNNTDFKIYNLGIFGLPVTFQKEDAKDIMDKMISVDISDVTDVDSKIYHCCEQTANNWVFNKYNYNVIEAYPYVDHLFDRKGECIEKAKYLLK